MNVTMLKHAIRLCRNANVAVFSWGRHGVGKSASISQLCRENKWGFVDFRASQIESSDLRGLPDRQEGRTIYFPPEDLPHGEFICFTCAGQIGCNPTFGDNGSFAHLQKLPDKCPHGHKNEDGKTIAIHEGILFLDELNRADDDVLQASFQLVLDRRLGRYMLPTGWSVVAAGNYQQGYMVNTFNDPAFLDRFCHVQLTVTDEYMQDWADYMSKFKGSADRILQFVAFDKAFLMPKMETGLGFTVTASPRSWEFVARVLAEADRESYPKEVVREVLSGLIGLDLTIQFERFSTEVTPSDVLDKGIKTIEGKLKGFNRNQLVGLVWGVASHAKDRFKEPKGRKELIKNSLDFMQYLATAKERDMAVMFGKQLTETEIKTLGGAVLSNPNLANMVAKYKGKNDDSWIAAIAARPELQTIMSKVSFGL